MVVVLTAHETRALREDAEIRADTDRVHVGNTRRSSDLCEMKYFCHPTYQMGRKEINILMANGEPHNRTKGGDGCCSLHVQK